MTVREILKMGDARLLRVAQPVRAFDTPELHALIADMFDTMAAANGYQVGQISRILYVAEGSSADYYYWKHQSLSYGVEITTDKSPPSSSIPSVTTEDREMIWKFIEHF